MSRVGQPAWVTGVGCCGHGCRLQNSHPRPTLIHGAGYPNPLRVVLLTTGVAVGFLLEVSTLFSPSEKKVDIFAARGTMRPSSPQLEHVLGIAPFFPPHNRCSHQSSELVSLQLSILSSHSFRFSCRFMTLHQARRQQWPSEINSTIQITHCSYYTNPNIVMKDPLTNLTNKHNSPDGMAML
jgi:hypothetical protein